MNTYQMIILFVQSLNLSGRNPLTLRQACLGGQLPISYTHARRVVKRATENGDLKLERAEGQQGRPLKVSAE